MLKFQRTNFLLIIIIGFACASDKVVPASYRPDRTLGFASINRPTETLNLNSILPAFQNLTSTQITKTFIKPEQKQFLPTIYRTPSITKQAPLAITDQATETTGAIIPFQPQEDASLLTIEQPYDATQPIDATALEDWLFDAQLQLLAPLVTGEFYPLNKGITQNAIGDIVEPLLVTDFAIADFQLYDVSPINYANAIESASTNNFSKNEPLLVNIFTQFKQSISGYKKAADQLLEGTQCSVESVLVLLQESYTILKQLLRASENDKPLTSATEKLSAAASSLDLTVFSKRIKNVLRSNDANIASFSDFAKEDTSGNWTSQNASQLFSLMTLIANDLTNVQRAFDLNDQTPPQQLTKFVEDIIAVLNLIRNSHKDALSGLTEINENTNGFSLAVALTAKNGSALKKLPTTGNAISPFYAAYNTFLNQTDKNLNNYQLDNDYKRLLVDRHNNLYQNQTTYTSPLIPRNSNTTASIEDLTIDREIDKDCSLCGHTQKQLFLLLRFFQEYRYLHLDSGIFPESKGTLEILKPLVGSLSDDNKTAATAALSNTSTLSIWYDPSSFRCLWCRYCLRDIAFQSVTIEPAAPSENIKTLLDVLFFMWQRSMPKAQEKISFPYNISIEFNRWIIALNQDCLTYDPDRNNLVVDTDKIDVLWEPDSKSVSPTQDVSTTFLKSRIARAIQDLWAATKYLNPEMPFDGLTTPEVSPYVKKQGHAPHNNFPEPLAEDGVNNTNPPSINGFAAKDFTGNDAPYIAMLDLNRTQLAEAIRINPGGAKEMVENAYTTRKSAKIDNEGIGEARDHLLALIDKNTQTKTTGSSSQQLPTDNVSGELAELEGVPPTPPNTPKSPADSQDDAFNNQSLLPTPKDFQIAEKALAPTSTESISPEGANQIFITFARLFIPRINTINISLAMPNLPPNQNPMLLLQQRPADRDALVTSTATALISISNTEKLALSTITPQVPDYAPNLKELVQKIAASIEQMTPERIRKALRTLKIDEGVFFDALKTSKESAMKMVNKAYHKQSLKTHPDKPSGNEEAFKEVVIASKTLQEFIDQTSTPVDPAESFAMPGTTASTQRPNDSKPLLPEDLQDVEGVLTRTSQTPPSTQEDLKKTILFFVQQFIPQINPTYVIHIFFSPSNSQQTPYGDVVRQLQNPPLDQNKFAASMANSLQLLHNRSNSQLLLTAPPPPETVGNNSTPTLNQVVEMIAEDLASLPLLPDSPASSAATLPRTDSMFDTPATNERHRRKIGEEDDPLPDLFKEEPLLDSYYTLPQKLPSKMLDESFTLDPSDKTRNRRPAEPVADDSVFQSLMDMLGLNPSDPNDPTAASTKELLDGLKARRRRKIENPEATKELAQNIVKALRNRRQVEGPEGTVRHRRGPLSDLLDLLEINDPDLGNSVAEEWINVSLNAALGVTDPSPEEIKATAQRLRKRLKAPELRNRRQTTQDDDPFENLDSLETFLTPKAAINSLRAKVRNVIKARGETPFDAAVATDLPDRNTDADDEYLPKKKLKKNAASKKNTTPSSLASAPEELEQAVRRERIADLYTTTSKDTIQPWLNALTTLAQSLEEDDEQTTALKQKIEAFKTAAIPDNSDPATVKQQFNEILTELAKKKRSKTTTHVETSESTEIAWLLPNLFEALTDPNTSDDAASTLGATIKQCLEFFEEDSLPMATKGSGSGKPRPSTSGKNKLSSILAKLQALQNQLKTDELTSQLGELIKQAEEVAGNQTEIQDMETGIRKLRSQGPDIEDESITITKKPKSAQPAIKGKVGKQTSLRPSELKLNDEDQLTEPIKKMLNKFNLITSKDNISAVTSALQRHRRTSENFDDLTLPEIKNLEDLKGLLETREGDEQPDESTASLLKEINDTKSAGLIQKIWRSFTDRKETKSKKDEAEAKQKEEELRKQLAQVEQRSPPTTPNASNASFYSQDPLDEEDDGQPGTPASPAAGEDSDWIEETFKDDTNDVDLIKRQAKSITQSALEESLKQQSWFGLLWDGVNRKDEIIAILNTLQPKDALIKVSSSFTDDSLKNPALSREIVRRIANRLVDDLNKAAQDKKKTSMTRQP